MVAELMRHPPVDPDIRWTTPSVALVFSATSTDADRGPTGDLRGSATTRSPAPASAATARRLG
jgi:hypothetical protein